MYNYWTEGGFIAWGQEPDPNTGRTSLQLFMDGRAQAAYDHKAYQVWQEIVSGGPVVHKARIRKQKLTTKKYAEIGKWVAKQLRKHKVWVVLMPAVEAGKPFAKGLEHNLNWPLVFFNNKQELFVDVTTPQGKELFEGIFNGKTLYPDEFSRNLILSHNMLLFGKGEDAKKRGLLFAIKAFELNPSQIPMRKIIYAARFAELKPFVNDFCNNYFDDFIRNKDSYAEKDGYLHRIWAALIAAEHLQRVALSENNTKLAQFYGAKKQEFSNEQKPLHKRKRW